MFIKIAGDLGGGRILLYWLCVVIAGATGIIGLGGLVLYVYRMLFPTRVAPAGSEPAPD